MAYVYELYPTDINHLESPVITLHEGLNELQSSEKTPIHIRAHNGSVTWNGEKKVHNDIVKIDYEGEIFERVISIVKRGELNVVESRKLNDWESGVKGVWPSHIEVPRIGFSHKQNEMYLLKIRWRQGSHMRVGHMLEIRMLALPASSLLWCPFPDMDAIPDMNELASICMERPFHTVRPVKSSASHTNGRAAQVKRADIEVPLSLRTACFEHEYPFSGTIHPKETRTPASLLNLCRLVEDIFSHGRGKGPNMILVNYYPTGHHKISRHQDNDKAMGVLRDVYAFVDGHAREMEFAKEWNQKNKTTSTTPTSTSTSTTKTKVKTDDAECVLKVNIPAGFYCMYGQQFQRLFTHEIKETYDKEFKHLCKSLKRLPAFADMPSKDANNRTKIPQAEYIMRHADAVRNVVMKTQNQQASILEMFEKKSRATDECRASKKRRCSSWFDYWIQPRISYTLRRFE